MARRQEYNDLVSGGCLVSGVVTGHKARTTQDHLGRRALVISSPQPRAGYDLDIASALWRFFPNLQKADLPGVEGSQQALAQHRKALGYA